MEDDEILVDPYEIRIADNPLAGREVRPYWADRAEPRAVHTWWYRRRVVVAEESNPSNASAHGMFAIACSSSLTGVTIRLLADGSGLRIYAAPAEELSGRSRRGLPGRGLQAEVSTDNDADAAG
jgi:hypothetical protein